MSDVERIFDRFIDAFAQDLLEIAKAYIDVEMGRALAVAERSNSKQTKAQLRTQKKQQRLVAKAQLKVDKQRKREEKRAARLADKERIKADRIAEKEQRQVEHDRLKQERMALKHELESERRRLREASRKRPVRQLPLDFDGLRTPKPRRGAPAVNAPPQLFVHKRKRDGQIEKLARNDAPDAPTNGAVPVTNGAVPVTNGVAASPPSEAAPPAE
jgi:hypothetical protein